MLSAVWIIALCGLRGLTTMDCDEIPSRWLQEKQRKKVQLEMVSTSHTDIHGTCASSSVEQRYADMQEVETVGVLSTFKYLMKLIT